MEEKSSTERKNLFIKTIVLIVLLLLALLSTMLYIFAYPKTTVVLYDQDMVTEIGRFSVRKYSALSSLPAKEKPGHEFVRWTYENGDELDVNREVQEETLNLYAQYNILSYTITYHVQVIDPITGNEVYVEGVQECEPVTLEYATQYRLPDGKDNQTGEMIKEFADRKGYRFVGWTTKILAEENVQPNDIHYADSIFTVPAGNVDFYAYWEKMRFGVVMHTGVEYETVDGTPVTQGGKLKTDANGEYIIKNDRVRNETEIKYLDYMTMVTDKFTEVSVTEEEVKEGHEEYEFLGWYADPDFTVKVNNYMIEVLVDDNNVPYLSYKDGDVVKTIDSVYDVASGTYKFHLYSKWARKSYILSFDTNSVRTKQKIQSVKIYKYDNLYGKYYNYRLDGRYEGVADYTREGEASGKYYNHIDLSSTEITTSSFMNSIYDNRFIGWTTEKDVTTEGNRWYYQWTQTEYNRRVVGANNVIEYINKDYIHTESKNVTLYAQWSTIYTVIFAHGEGFNTSQFEKQVIRGEWFWLPGSTEIASYGWEKKYNDFTGWTTSLSSANATKYREFDTDGLPSVNFAYEHKSINNIRLYAIWEPTKYSIYFYNNDGSENDGKGSLFTTYPIAYGNADKTFPSTKPTREGYVFEGWSRKQYAVDEYATDGYNNVSFTAENKAYGANSLQKFKVTGNEDFYAVWTKDYKVSYNANGGTGTVPSSNKYVLKKPLLIDVTPVLPAVTSLKLEGNAFAGWQLKAPDGSILSDEKGNPYIFTSDSGQMRFDFKNKTVRFSKNGQTITAEVLLEGANLDEVNFYAKWNPKKYKIELKNTQNNNKAVKYDATYGQTFNFLDYDGKNINAEYSKVGFIFKGWALKDTDTEPLYVDSIPGDKIIENITLYTVYEQKTINLHYYIEQFDGTIMEFNPTMGTTSQVGYGGKVVLPTPSPSNYGNNAYVFSHWFYYSIPGDETSEKITLENEQEFYYTEDDVDLFSVFIPLTYDLTFNFVTPYENEKPNEDGSVNPRYFNITITRTVDKNSRITDDLYNGIISEFLNKLTIQNGTMYSQISDYMKEYSFDGLYNFYSGNDGGKAEFMAGKLVSGDNFKVLNSFNEVSFDAVWNPNNVKIAYRSAKVGYEEVVGAETYNYTYDDGIKLHNGVDLFQNLNSSNKIVKWYLDETHKYDVDSNFISAGTKLSTLSNYITWVYDENIKSYVGYIYLYAETEKLFTINYLVYDISSGEYRTVLTETDIKYNPTSNTYLIPSDAKTKAEEVNSMAFEEWRIGSINGSSLKTNTILLNPEAYADGIINLYAMVSFNLNYNYLDSGLQPQELISEKINYYSNGSFYGQNSNNIPAIVKARIASAISGIAVPSGYKLYGLQSNGQIYNSTTAVIPLTGIDTNILVYIAKEISITYDVKSYDAKFVSNNDLINGTDINIVREGYLVGYDGTKISEIRVDELSASKGYDVFNGWKIVGGDDKTYIAGQILPLTDSVTLMPVFSSIEAGDVSVKIIYKNTKVQDLPNNQTTATNGSSIVLKTGSELTWELDGYTITGWLHNGIKYDVGASFVIPIQVLQGQEFVFESIYTEVYTINFNKVLSDEFVDSVEPVKVVDGKELTITNTVIPFVKNNNKSIEFDHYKFEFIAKDGEIITYNIFANDKVIISSTEKNPRSEDSAGYYTHYIPKVDSFIFTFEAIWKTADVTLNIVVTDSADNSTVNSGSITVKYGDNYTPRTLIEQYKNSEIMQILLSKETYLQGVVGFSSSNNNIADNTLLTNIVGTKTIYTVWATKYSITYNTGNYKYNSGVPETSYCFANESVSIDSSITKSISQNGYLTVYFDNGNYIVYNEEETLAHTVTGYTIYKDGEVYQTININESFDMPAGNVTITPVFGNVTKLNFRENGAVNNGQTIVKTMYLLPQKNQDLNEIKISRNGFEFKGWMDKDGNAITSYTATSNAEVVDFYAIWVSDIKVSFYVSTMTETGTDELFAINVDNAFRIDSTLLEEELNKFRNTTLVLGNTNIYTYNGINYYLDYYQVGSDIVDLSELLALPFQTNSKVYIKLVEIYTIKYDTESYTTTIPNNYITTYGNLVAVTAENTTGISETLKLPKITVDTTNSYEIPSKWGVESWVEGFDTEINLNKMQQLIYGYANENYIITLDVVCDAKSYNVKAYAYTGSNLYDVYKNAESSDDVLSELTVITDKLINNNGIYLTTEGYSIVDNKIALPYGSLFGIAIDEDYYNINNFTLVGWAITLDKLNAESILVNSRLSYDSVNRVYVCNNIIVDEEYFDENNEIILYPVYTADTKIFSVVTDNYGTVDVTIEAISNDGYISYIEESQTTNVAVKTNANVEISVLDKVTISVASCINANLYEFDKFTKNNSTTALSNPLELTYATVANEDIYYSTFKTREIAIKFNLNYAVELKDPDTVTNIMFVATSGTTVELTDLNRTTNAITFNATDVISVSYEINTLYTMTATSNGRPITITRGYLEVDELSVIDGVYDVTITLTPNFYTITFALYGGTLSDGSITATNEVFEVSTLNLVDGKISVPVNTRITVTNNPTKEYYVFTKWNVNGTECSNITDLLINSNLVISAEYVTNRFAINYQIDDARVTNYFIGGDSVTLVVDESNIPTGYTISKWKDINTGSEYNYGSTITNTESRTYTLVATLVGKEFNIVYVDTLGNTLKTDTVIYGNPYTIAYDNISEFTGLDHTKSINWYLDGSYYRQEQAIATSNLEYAEEVNLTLVYFNKYTYTIDYVLEKSYDVQTETEISDVWNTEISNSIYQIHSYNAAGDVLDSYLTVAVNSATPLHSNNEYYGFGGYYVKFNGEYVTDKDGNKITVSPNTKFTFVKPTAGIFNYTYEFIPVRVNSSEAKTLTFNITNPEDNSSLTTIQVQFIVRKLLTVDILPNIKLDTIDGNEVTWTTGQKTQYFDNYELIGYEFEGQQFLFTETNGWGIFGYDEYVFTSIWKERTIVNFYDQTLNKIESISGYYNQGVLDLSKFQSNYAGYTKDGYYFLGLTQTNTSIVEDTPYFTFEDTINVGTSEINLYPAFTKVYTIQLNTNVDTLVDKIDNSYTAQGYTLANTAELYVTNDTVDLSVLYEGIYYGDSTSAKRGYSLAGFSLVGGKLKHENVTLINNGLYELNPSHASGSIITIYLVWERETIDVTLAVDARYNDNTEFNTVSNSTIEVFYNQLFDESKVEEFYNTAVNAASYWTFDDYYLGVNGQNKVTSETRFNADNMIVYLHFNPKYTVVYEAEDFTINGTLPEPQVVEPGVTAVNNFSITNISKAGLIIDYWTAEGANNADFFSVSPRKIDLENDKLIINKYYQIILVPHFGTAKYTINIHYLDSEEKIHSYLKGNNGVSFSTTVVTGVEYGDYLAWIDGENIITMFDGDLTFNGRSGLNYYNEYVKDITNNTHFTASIFVTKELGEVTEDNELYSLADMGFDDICYTVGLFDGDEELVNDLYIYYEYRYYGVNIVSVDEAGNEIEADVSIKVDGGEKESYTNGVYAQLNIDQTIEFMSPDEQDGYIFKGYFVKNAGGEFVPLDSNYAEFATLTSGKYSIFKDCEVFAVYEERLLDIIVKVYIDNQTGAYAENLLDENLGVQILYNGDVIDDTLNDLDKDNIQKFSELTKSVQYGKDLVIYIYSGESSKYQFSRTDVKKNSDISITTSYSSMYGMYLSLDNVGSNVENFVFEVYFELKPVEVYFNTNVKLNTDTTELIDDIALQAIMPESLQYTTLSVFESNIYISEAIYNKVSYNYMSTIKYGSTINVDNIIPTLNNCTFVGWFNASGEQVTGEVTVESNIYLTARFTANIITVNYYDNNNNIIYQEQIQFGKTLTLPYIIVEDDKTVSCGWSLGEWGQEIVIDNISEDYSTNGFAVKADVVDKFYLIYNSGVEAGFDGFNLPSDYPTSITDPNVEKIALLTIALSANVNYRIYNGTLSEIQNSGEGLILFNEKSYIIDTPIPDSNGVQFVAWKTKTGREVNNIDNIGGRYYSPRANEVDEIDGKNVVTLYPMTSSTKSIHFYITDPTDSDNYTLPGTPEMLESYPTTVNLSTSSINKDFSQEYIALEIEATTQTLDEYVTIGSVRDDIVEFYYNSNGRKSFFVNNLEADNTTSKKLTYHYTFYGWTTKGNQTVFSDIRDLLNSSAGVLNNYALLYSIDANGERIDENTALIDNSFRNSLNNLVINQNKYDLYAVWEINPTITFDATSFDSQPLTNGFTAEYKFGRGVEVNFNEYPDSNKVDALSYTGHKLTGWSDGNLVYNLGSSNNKYYVGDRLNLSSVWAVGTKVFFDINFEAQRTYYANAVSTDTNPITTSLVGYPHIPTSEMSNYKASTNTNVNGVTYPLLYQEGEYWAEGETLSLLKYADSMFSHNGIYLASATKDKYFYLKGWEYNNVVYDPNLYSDFTITSSLANAGTIIFKAVWEVIEIEVQFYYSARDIQDNNSEQYRDENGLISIYVPFGYRLTSIESQAKNDIVYLYGEYSSLLAKPENYKESDSSLRPFWRFMYWSSDYNHVSGIAPDRFLVGVQTQEFKANSVSTKILDDVKLFPYFIRQYEVRFMTTMSGQSASLLFNASEYENAEHNYVAINENIIIKENLNDNMGEAIKVVSDIYTGFYDGKYGIGTHAITTDTASIKFTGNDTDFTINYNRYVDIFVEIKVTVYTYIPNPQNSGNSAIEYFTTEIPLGQNYWILNQSKISNNDLVTRYGNNAPEFDGWYYDETSNPTSYYANKRTNAYKLTGAGVKAVTRYVCNYNISDSTVSFVINITFADGDEVTEDIAIQDDKLIVNFFAKLTTTTTVALSSNSDSRVSDYAYLSIEDDANKDYYEILIGEIAGRTKVVKYKNVFRSEVAPNVVVMSIEDKFYTVEKADLYQGDYAGTPTKLNKSLNIVTSNNYYKNVNSLSFISTTTGLNSEINYSKSILSNAGAFAGFKHVFSVYNIDKGANNTIIQLTVAPIKYEVTYTWDTEREYLVLKNKSADSGFNIDVTDNSATAEIEGSEITFSDIDVSLYDGVGNIVNNYTVEYYSQQSGSLGTITFTNVPYGAKLFVFARPVDNLLHHFDSWQVGSTYKNVGDITNVDYGLITPSDLNDSNTEVVKSYTITPVLVLNTAKSITLKLFIPQDVLENKITRGGLTQEIWGNIVEDIKSSISNVASTGNGYEILFETDVAFDFNNTEAGDNIDTYINSINAYYNNVFNTSVGLGSSLGYLLNYMWFTGEWRTFERDKNQFNLNALDNTIKFVQDADITLYTYLDEALLINVNDRTLDYFVNDMELSGVHRITFNGFKYTNASLGESTCGRGTVGKLNDNMYVLANDSNNIAIKMKYDYNTTISVNASAYDATDNHVAYIIKDWRTNNAVSSNEIDLTTNLNKNNNLYITQTNVMYPEVNLLATAIAKTYKVTFTNSDGATLSSIDLAYDNELSDKYPQYGFTLGYIHSTKNGNNEGYINSELYNTDGYSNYLIPLFALDSLDVLSKTKVSFVNPIDEQSNAREYGEFKYLFTHWSLNGATFEIDKVIKTDNYANIVLKANYASTIEIEYRVFDASDYNSVKALLPERPVVDCFGKTYSDDLWVNYIKTRLNHAKGDIAQEGSYFYVSEGTSIDNNIELSTLMSARGYARVATVRDVLNAGYGRVVYPAVKFALNIQGVDTNIYTFGGAYVVGNDGVNVNLKLYNLLGLTESEITATGTIKFKTYNARSNEELSFAYWDYNSNYILSENRRCVEEITLSEHYNPKFKFNQTEVSSAGEVKGTISFNKIIENSGSNPYSLFTITPTATYLAGDTTGTKYTYNSDNGSFSGTQNARYFLRYDSMNQDAGKGITYAEAGFYSKINGTETLLYKFAFTRNSTVQTIIEQVSFNIMAANTEYNFSLVDLMDVYYVNDASGALTISVSVFGAPVGLKYSINEYFAITELNNTYKYSTSQYLSFSISNEDIENNPDGKVKSGSICHVDETSSGLKLTFTEFGTNTPSSVSAEVKFDGSSWADIKENLYNIRLQYSADSGATWVDIVDDVTIIDGYNGKEVLDLRAVASWYTANIVFDMFDNSDTSYTSIYTVNDVPFSLSNTKNITGNYIYVSNVANPTNSHTIQLLAGDTIYYDVNNETITLNTQNYGTITIKIDNLASNGLMFQGWIQEVDNSLVTLRESSSAGGYKAVKNETYIYRPIIEKEIKSSIVVDNTTPGNIWGYGKVDVKVYALKSMKSYTLDKIISETIDGKTIYYYAYEDTTDGNQLKKINIVSGETTSITLNISENEEIYHNYKSFSYGKSNVDDSRRIDTSSERSLNLKELVTDEQYKNYVYVLFDAKSTESTYTIIDGVFDSKANATQGKIRYNSIKLYGGYTIKYETKTDDGIYTNITIKDHFDVVVKEIRVYEMRSKTSSDNTSSNPVKLYATNGFKINKLSHLLLTDTQNISGVVGTNFMLPDSHYTNRTISTDGVYYHKGLNIVTKAIIDKFDEYLKNLDLSYEIKIIDEDGYSLQTNSSTSIDTAYLYNVKENETVLQQTYSDIDRILSVLIDDGDKSGSAKLAMHYNVNDGGINLIFGNAKMFDSHREDTVVFNSKYQLKSVSIDGAICDYWDYETPVLDNSASSTTVELTGNTKLVITLIQKSRYDLAFKLTLPYESDFNNLSISGSIIDPITNEPVEVENLINKVDKKGTNASNLVATADYTVKVPVGSTIKLSTNTSTTQAMQIINNGIVIGNININFVRPKYFNLDQKLSDSINVLNTTYENMFENTIYLDSSTTSKIFKLESQSWTTSSSGVVPNSVSALTKYNLWGFDKFDSNVKPVDSTEKEINGDSTIVIALKRKDVKIVIDHSTTKNNNTFLDGYYLCTCGQGVKLGESSHSCSFAWNETYGMGQYFNASGEYKYSQDSYFTVPGGLVRLFAGDVAFSYVATTLDDYDSFVLSVKDNDPAYRTNSGDMIVSNYYDADCAGLSIRNNDNGVNGYNYFLSPTLVGSTSYAIISAPVNNNPNTIMSMAIVNDDETDNITVLNQDSLLWYKSTISLPTGNALSVKYKDNKFGTLTLKYGINRTKGLLSGFNQSGQNFAVNLSPSASNLAIFDDNNSNSLFISKYKITLFKELYTTADQFRSNLENQDNLVYDEQNAKSGYINMGTSNHSQYKSILIEPIWEVKRIRTITISNTFSNYNINLTSTQQSQLKYEVEEGKNAVITLNMTDNLNLVTTSDIDKMSSKNIYTLLGQKSGLKYFFNGLYGNLHYYKIVGDVKHTWVGNVWNSSSVVVNGTYISTPNTYQITIQNVTTDITLTPIFTQYGKTLTYTFNGDVHYYDAAGVYQTTSKDSTFKSTTTFNLVEGMGHSIMYYLNNYKKSAWKVGLYPTPYFHTSNVSGLNTYRCTKTYNHTCGSSCTPKISTNITFSLSHSNHNSVWIKTETGDCKKNSNSIVNLHGIYTREHYSCSYCSYNDSTSAWKLDEDAMVGIEDIVKYKPDTTTKHTIIYCCSICGAESIKPDGSEDHKYKDEWTVEKESTCTAQGRKSRLCVYCGFEQGLNVAKLDHEYTIIKSWDSGYCTNATVTLQCKNCTATKSQSNYVLAGTHKLDSGKVTSAATCTNAGNRKFYCTYSYRGKTCAYFKNQTINRLGHNFIIAGSETYTSYNDRDEIISLVTGADYSKSVAKETAEVFCYANIYIYMVKCSRCGNYVSKYNTANQTVTLTSSSEPADGAAVFFKNASGSDYGGHYVQFDTKWWEYAIGRISYRCQRSACGEKIASASWWNPLTGALGSIVSNIITICDLNNYSGLSESQFVAALQKQINLTVNYYRQLLLNIYTTSNIYSTLNMLDAYTAPGGGSSGGGTGGIGSNRIERL